MAIPRSLETFLILRQGLTRKAQIERISVKPYIKFAPHYDFPDPGIAMFWWSQNLEKKTRRLQFSYKINLGFGGYIMDKKSQNKQNLVILFIGMMIMFACVSEGTVTPTVALPTTTNTPCPNVPYTPAVSSVQKPTFYFVLIDGTLNYTTQNITDSRRILEIALFSLIGTGDRVVIGWINDNAMYYGIESTIFYNDVFAFDTDHISLTPTLPPTLGPFDTPTVIPTSEGQLRQTEVVRAA